ncbi:hypothetical protein RJ639_015649 [Escallonia herrerae]|uniref:Uncharacterized protein n=1 Tax=Escallonia herrerae TaxID=1293975 RepID=A0AA88VDU4_9ASTE|nr:hypothetical protein RJ639_015649 [Escallonia herrerae]
MSSVEFQEQKQEAVRRRQEDQEEGMEVKLSSPGEPMKVNEEEEDGFKTPTSLDHKIPLIFPKAPRKPKYSIPVAKRKARRRIQLDISAEEIESFFPPAQLSLKDCGGKIKKIRKANMTKKLGYEETLASAKVWLRDDLVTDALLTLVNACDYQTQELILIELQFYFDHIEKMRASFIELL